MLTMPADAGSCVTIIGIDPGSDTLGVWVLWIDLATEEIVRSEAFTLKGAREGRGSFATEIHGDRHGRIESHRANLLEIFRHYNPLSIAVESPFMSRRMPSAYGALVEVGSAIRRAAFQFDPWRTLTLIDPPTVKRAVGVAGKSGGPEGKKLMLSAVTALDELLYAGEIPLLCLDEHSIDALAVAYCHFIRFREDLCLRMPKPSVSESSLLSLPGSSTRTIRAGRKSRRFKKK